MLGQNAEADASPLATRVVQAVLDAQHPKQDNTTAAILKPPADWLLAPFGFAPPPLVVLEADPANSTQRIVPRAPQAPSAAAINRPRRHESPGALD